MIQETQRCPCGTGLRYGECCAPLHRGERPAPTAEMLMRSRFSAYVVRNADYLLNTWDPMTRPQSLDLDHPGAPEFYLLEILRTERGGPFDVEGIVEFAAHYRGAARGVQHETSRFYKKGKNWFYQEAI